MILKSRPNNFNNIRNLLAILVFITHWNILTGFDSELLIFHLSGFAIDSFFVVSGFLIWWSFDSDNNFYNFYLKRFFRIFPLYFLVILFQSLFFYVVASEEKSEVINYFVANIFFLNFIVPTVGDSFLGLNVNAINGSLWTLKNELFFYFIVPLLYFMYKRFGVKSLLIVFLFSALYYIFFRFMKSDYYFIYKSLSKDKMMVLFPAQLRLFVAGILIYIYVNKVEVRNPVLLFLLSLLLIVLFRGGDIFRSFFYPVFLGFFIIFLVYHVKVFIFRFDFSYSLYIVHFPLIQLMLYFNINPSNALFSFILILSLTLGISLFSEKYIENKFVLVGRGLLESKR